MNDMLNSVIFLEFEFNIHNGMCTTLNTNLKTEHIEEFLEEWVTSQLSTGADASPANKRDSYHITIRCDLQEDTFMTISDTGNKGLTTGIVAAVFAHRLWEKVAN